MYRPEEGFVETLEWFLTNRPDEVDLTAEIADLSAAETALGRDATDTEMFDWLVANRGYQRGPLLCRVGWAGKNKKLHRAEACYRVSSTGKFIVHEERLFCASRKTVNSDSTRNGYTSFLDKFEAFDAGRITCEKCK